MIPKIPTESGSPADFQMQEPFDLPPSRFDDLPGPVGMAPGNVSATDLSKPDPTHGSSTRAIESMLPGASLDNVRGSAQPGPSGFHAEPKKSFVQRTFSEHNHAARPSQTWFGVNMDEFELGASNNSPASPNAPGQPRLQAATSSLSALRPASFLRERFRLAFSEAQGEESCWRCKNNQVKCGPGIPCYRCAASKGNLAIPCHRGHVCDVAAEIPFLCHLPLGAQRPPHVQQLPQALQAGARLLSQTGWRRLNDRDSARMSGTRDHGIFWSVVNTKIPNINGFDPFGFTDMMIQVFELPYDDLIMKIVWEMGDNSETSKLLAIGSLEDLVALLEAASLCESEFGDFNPKTRLVYTSMQLLFSCLEALRLSAYGLLASNTHTYCNLNNGCINPAFAGIAKYATRYTEALTRAFFHNSRVYRNHWLLVFYSLCLQGYIRCALMAIERLHRDPLQPHDLTAKYLAPAVDLFLQISMQKRGMLGRKICNAQVKPSVYLREAGVDVGGIRNSWQEWRNVEGLASYMRRIFNVGIPTNISTTIATAMYDRIHDQEPSTSALTMPSHFNVGIRQPELKDDTRSVVAPSISTFADSLFSHQSEVMSVATSISPRNSWDGSVHGTKGWSSWLVEEDVDDSMSLDPEDSDPEVHEFTTSDALLAYINPFLTAENGTPVIVSWQWGLPEFIRAEESTEDLDLESEVVLVTSVDRGKQHTRQRFYALTWLELFEQELGPQPEISAFLAKVTAQTATRLEEVNDKGVVYSHQFGDQCPLPVEIQLNWSSIQLKFSQYPVDPLFGDLLRAVGYFCQVFRKSKPSQQQTCSSIVRWQVQRLPIEVISNENQAGKSSDVSNNLPGPGFEIAMSLSETPLEAFDHGCWQKLFVGGGNLIELAERTLGDIAAEDEKGEGLETSFEMMVSLAAVEYPILVDEGVVFVGYDTVLVPVAVGDNWAQFHLLTNDRPRGQINPYTMDLGPRLMTKDFRQFQGKRCFLGWCKLAQIQLGTRSLPADLGYSGGREKEKSAVFDGVAVSSQFGVSAPLSALFGIEANVKHRRNRVQFTSSGGYSKLLYDTAEELAAVYDARARRCWLVPTLSLLLHMSHAYALSRLRTFKHTVPYADGHVDADGLVSLLEDHGDVLVLGKTQQDGLTFRQLLLGLNTNLLRAVESTENSTGLTLYGFEFMDVVTGPGRGSCMKEFDLTSPGKKWLAVVNVVNAVVVCAGIGDVITAVRPNHPSNGATATANGTCRNGSPCNILPPDRDYMATTVSCLKRLARRGGDPLDGTDSTFKLSYNLVWHVMGEIFKDCPHDEEEGSDSNSSPDSCWKRQEMMQQISPQKAISRFWIGLNTLNNKGKDAQSVGEPSLTKKSISNTGAVVFG